MDKKNLKKNSILKYIFIIFVSLTIFLLFVFLFNIFNKDKNKEKAEQEIKETIQNWAKVSFNIGDFDNFSVNYVEETEKREDKTFNTALRQENCKEAINYLGIDDNKKTISCIKSSTIMSYIDTFYNTSKMEDLKINKIVLSNNNTEAYVLFDLSINMKIMENLQTDYVENAKPYFRIKKLKEPLNFYDLKIELKKKNDKWFITKDKSVRNNLYQLYALYIDEKMEGNMVFPEIDKWVLINE